MCDLPVGVELCGVRCSKYGYEFAFGELYGEDGDRAVCLDCAERELSRLSPAGVFGALGLDPVRQVRGSRIEEVYT